MVFDYRSFSLLRQAGPPGLLLAASRCGAHGGGLHFNRGFSRCGEKHTWAERRRGDISVEDQLCVQVSQQNEQVLSEKREAEEPN